MLIKAPLLESHHVLPHRTRVCRIIPDPNLHKTRFPPHFTRTSSLQALRLPESNQREHKPSFSMTFDMDWSPDFCLACDRQTDGNVYCSEACRLAEYENSSSNAGSLASSPISPRSSVSWPTTRPTNNGFWMEPAYNFSKAQPYGSTPSSRTTNLYQPSRPQSSPVPFSSSRTVLTPSSSQSSLFSMQSSSSSSYPPSEPNRLSDESRKALRAYASSFDQSRYSRRQSTN